MPFPGRNYGRFPFSQNFRISGSAVNRTRFVGSSHWKIPRKSGKSKKVGPFSRLEFPNGMSCSISVSRSLYQFQVHRRAPRRTGVYDQMEQRFTNRKFHFCSHRNFPVFFPNGKRPIFCFIILGIEDEKESAFHFLYNCVKCCSGTYEEQNIHIW